MDKNIPPSEQSQQNKNNINFSLNLKFVVLLLLAVIAVMLVLWKPGTQIKNADTRTVQVTGNATLKAEPDEFVFSPSYNFKNANKQSALDALSKKSDEIVAQLKKLGIADNKIKTNSSDYQRGIYYPESNLDSNTYTLSLTVTAVSKDLAQKVQNYLLTTTPSGSVTPQANFSVAKRNQLEKQARSQAEKDAKSKADQSAQNIGFKLGKVKSISEGSGFGGIQPLYESGGAATKDSVNSSTSLSVQPGENDLSYQISVTYFIK